MPKINAKASDAGRRLDAWLAEELDISRTAAVSIAAGLGLPKSYRLTGAESFEINEKPPEQSGVEGENIPLDIVYEDADLLVVNKSRGLVVHPAPGHNKGTLVNALIYHCGDSLSGIGGVTRPGIVHRLDKDTSGLMLAAKNDFAHQKLSEALKNREISRIYMAIVQGRPDPESGIIDAPIDRHPKDRIRMAVVKGGRTAKTHYKTIEQLKGYTLVQCKLETGRTHQIRVHLSHIGHPVAGDTLYGAKEIGTGGQLLHATELHFTHPRTNELLSFANQPPWKSSMTFSP
ncbi:pseudouridine synthase [Clostridia bacterium]|nr:pseudouridine synthase [Clostridia bacterium]